MVIRTAGAVLAVVLATGCAGDKGRATAEVRDSAAVHIALTHNAEQLPPLRWRVDTAGVEIGSSEAEASRPLFQITGATRLSDGRIVVGSAGNHELRFYSAQGALLATAGRMGRGPGEFQALMWLARIRGDSVVAWDAAASRLSVFDPSGGFVRAVTPDGLGLFPRALGALEDGRVLVAAGAGASIPQLGKSRRDTLSYVLLRADGGLDTLGRFPGEETIAIQDATGMLIRPLPFGRATVAATHGSRVFISTADRYEIGEYDVRGGLRGLIRTDKPSLAVTPSDIRDYREKLVTLGGAGDSDASRKQRLLLDQAPYPAQMPAITGLKTDTEGNLWVRESQQPGDTLGTPWTVFDPRGQAVGTVRLPDALEVYAIGPDWLLGVQLDENHVEHVKLLPITR